MNIEKTELINTEKQAELAKRLHCIFCEDGEFAEMSLDLADYEEQTQPIAGASFGFFHGGIEKIKEMALVVDKGWVDYFTEDTPVFCGFVDGVPVSFCIVEPETNGILSVGKTKVGEVGCVGTMPQFRCRGIGLRMVDLATLYLKEKGCDKAYIHYTHIDRWYAKLGYQTFARFSFQKKE